MQHVWKGDVGGERTTARHQRTVLETGHGAADEGHLECSLPFVPAKAGTRQVALDSRFRLNERTLLLGRPTRDKALSLTCSAGSAAPRGCAAGSPETHRLKRRMAPAHR